MPEKDNRSPESEIEEYTKGINNLREYEPYTDSPVIIGGGDPNLSPDAGKPLI